MSASRKKALRREENQAAMTERQQQERKEAKKVRLYTVLFSLLITAMVVVVIATAVLSSGIIERNTTALTVNDSEISAVELNYFYMDTVNNYLSTYGDYLSFMGLNTTASLNEQYYDEAAGQTWADYFLETATESAKSTYALYQEAEKNGYTLSEELETAIDSTIASFDTYAMMYGYENAKSYLASMYGDGSDLDSFRHYMTVQYMADGYYDQVQAGLTYTDDDLRAAEAENYNTYSSYSYHYYYLPVGNFYEGGTTDESGEVTYSDEEIAAGVAAAKAAADELAATGTLEALDTAIAAMEMNADVENAASNAMSDTRYTSVDTLYRDWLAEDSRQANDMAVFESTSTTANEDGTESTSVNGYYVVCYQSKNDNTFPLVNVRHILLQHEGGTTDESGNVTYSDDEKATTLAKAENLLASFTGGEAEFATLANENSEDTGSNTNGGLYENIYPGQMVETFNDWSFDPSRQPGDTAILESDYGYHVMYFSSYSDTTYRDYMITNDLRSADIDAWYASVVDVAVVNVKNTDHVKKDLYLSADE